MRGDRIGKAQRQCERQTMRLGQANEETVAMARATGTPPSRRAPVVERQFCCTGRDATSTEIETRKGEARIDVVGGER